MTESLLKHFLWFCFFEMLLGAFGEPISSTPSFIRVPLKSVKNTASSLPNPYHYYVGAISLGNPPQPFNVFINTASAELAIRSPPALTNALVFPVYDSKKSATYMKNNTPANVTDAQSSYLDYIFSYEKLLQFGRGFLSTDTLRIGTATIKQQTFIEMTTIGSSMKSFSSFLDGVLGLAYPSATPSGATPFFQNMLQQGVITNPIFALTYSNISDEFELTLGGMDSTKFRGMLTWTPITEKRYWKFSVSGLVVRYSATNITRVSCNGPKGCQMVIDMNEDSIIGSREVLSRLGPLFGTTSFTGYQGIDCKTFQSTTLPDIGFTIAGNDFYLKPEQYMIADVWGYCRNPTSSSYRWTYFFPWTPIDKVNSYSEVWILGTPFLRAFSTVFDFGNNRIGFSPK